ncbi:MAG: winged helix-turn-helix transcriptional regulator [Chloroflexi bacterium]|nr:winged helix-turn-helix transcriptional regulator [Chloroflexota bacterium]
MARKSSRNRINKLTDVAEMYFLEGLTQAEIAKKVGVTRSMVSRMVTEARDLGIVKIKIERQFKFDKKLSNEFIQHFDLLDAVIYHGQPENYDRYLIHLGTVGARTIKPYLKDGIVVGAAWGTTLRSAIKALEIEHPLPETKIVQLVGALGERSLDIDGHELVHYLVNKLGGQGYYLNAPYIVDKPETVEALMSVQGVCETMEMMKECDLGLFGIGSTDLDYSTFFNAGYLVLDEMKGLAIHGAVGNVCGLFFNVEGEPTAREFQRRSLTISKRDLVKIPIRIGIAGGLGKIKAILGALRGDYINVLVTDDLTAAEVLRLAKDNQA